MGGGGGEEVAQEIAIFQSLVKATKSVEEEVKRSNVNIILLLFQSIVNASLKSRVHESYSLVFIANGGVEMYWYYILAEIIFSNHTVSSQLKSATCRVELHT